MTPLPFAAEPEDEVALIVVDRSLAWAFWQGVPIGRLLARIRLHRDERDLVDLAERANGAEFEDASWDTILARLLAAAPSSLERVRRGVARHARTASDEGPLVASDSAIAALVYAHLASGDADASPSEGTAEQLPVDAAVRAACQRFDERIGRDGGDDRASAFEACLELAKRAAGSSWPLRALHDALAAVARSELDGDAPRSVFHASTKRLYPHSADAEVAVADRRACALERGPLERVLMQPERDLGAAIQRASTRRPDLAVAAIASETTALVAKHGELVLLLTPEPRSMRAPPPLPPASWMPVAPDGGDAASLADAIERGSLTGPRARTLLLHGGDAALDAIGKEMLEVTTHPFASAVFAELLAPLARERDVVRLVTYFAIAPDPALAAHALDLCSARDVVCTVLRSWLETMLPTGGAVAEPGSDPAARVASYIEALRPYPALHAAVRPLLSRVSDVPPS